MGGAHWIGRLTAVFGQQILMYSGSKLTPRVDATFEIAIAIFFPLSVG